MRTYFIAYTVLLVSLAGNTFFSHAQSVWQVYDTNNSPMVNATVRALEKDQSGNLWVGTDHGLYAFDGTNWTEFKTTNSGIPGDVIRTLELDANDELWVGTFNNGVGHYDGSTWEIINTSNSDLPDNSIKAIGFDVHGDLFVGTTGGLAYRNDTGWTIWNVFNSDFFTNNVSSIAVDENNVKFVGTINGGLHILDSANTTVTVSNSYNSNALDNTLLGMELDSAGNPWMPTPAVGLAFYYNNSWTIWADFNSSIPTNSLNSIFIDKPNHLFYFTTIDKGLIRFDGLNFINWEMANSGIPEDHTLCVLKEASGVIWIGTNTKGLVRFEAALSINEAENNSAKVHPNPAVAGENLFFEPSNEIRELRLYNLQGQLLETAKIEAGKHVWSLPTPLPAGSYLLQFKSAQNSTVSRLVVE